MTYLSGLLTLDHSLKKAGSKYPLVALYTDSLSPEGHVALDSRNIAKKRIPYLLPSINKDYSHDTRFYDCWSKLTPFSLVEYERVVQLDSDMLVLQNMDELMELELDPPALGGKGSRVFAASHACVCNPLKRGHYPKNWFVFPWENLPGCGEKQVLTRQPRIHANCAFTTQHSCPNLAQMTGAPPDAGLGMPNGGLQVVNPSKDTYTTIVAKLETPSPTSYDFADQSLLADVFPGRWVSLPYVYNALKTLRWKGVHDAIWRDERVKNIHYILVPKPWNESEIERNGEGGTCQDRDPVNSWWWDFTVERWEEEKAKGIYDGF
jgi:alpha-N-acetylglucosamine transferase